MRWSAWTLFIPGMILKFGGHAMAAGLSLEEAQFERFQQRFGRHGNRVAGPRLTAGRSGVRRCSERGGDDHGGRANAA